MPLAALDGDISALGDTAAPVLAPNLIDGARHHFLAGFDALARGRVPEVAAGTGREGAFAAAEGVVEPLFEGTGAGFRRCPALATTGAFIVVTLVECLLALVAFACVLSDGVDQGQGGLGVEVQHLDADLVLAALEIASAEGDRVHHWVGDTQKRCLLPIQAQRIDSCP